MPEISRLPRPIASLWEWQYSGACRDLPTEVFFNPDGIRGPNRNKHENAAKAICASCPVIEQCRDHALTAQEPYGIWGGLTEDERLVILTNKLASKNLLNVKKFSYLIRKEFVTTNNDDSAIVAAA